MKNLRVTVIHCGETGSHALSVIAKSIAGEPALKSMRLVDPGIGVGDQCLLRGHAIPARPEFDLVLNIVCKTSAAKHRLESHLNPSYFEQREVNPALTLNDYLSRAPEIEFVEISNADS